MKAIKQILRPNRLAFIAATAALLPFGAYAQSATLSEMEARYQSDLQRCATITDAESKRTCQREAGAALQEFRRNQLLTHGSTAANASARCERLPAAQRADCERLMSDSSAVEHGSVSGGGVLRELTITIPAEQAAPSPTYGTQPVPGAYGSQPVQPAPTTPGAYGTVPVR